jgi:hypothetical protein
VTVTPIWTATQALTLSGLFPAAQTLGTIPPGSYGTLPLFVAVCAVKREAEASSLLQQLNITLTDGNGHQATDVCSLFETTSSVDGNPISAAVVADRQPKYFDFATFQQLPINVDSGVTIRTDGLAATGTTLTTHYVFALALFQQDLVVGSGAAFVASMAAPSAGVSSGTNTFTSRIPFNIGAIGLWATSNAIPDFTGSANWTDVVSRSSSFGGIEGFGTVAIGYEEPGQEDYRVIGYPSTIESSGGSLANNLVLFQTAPSTGRSWGTVIG